MLKNHQTFLLDLNENTAPWPQGLVKHLKQQTETFGFYTREADEQRLKNALAKKFTLIPDNFVLFPGSFAALTTLFTFQPTNQKKLLLPVPTFPFYLPLVATGRLTTKKIYLGDNRLTADSLKEYLTDDLGACYIVNPGNPFGLSIKSNELQKIIDLLANQKILLVLDEAYIDYGTDSMANQIKNYDQLIIVRSFSKSHGLSGLRLGYTISNTKLATELTAWRGPAYTIAKPAIIAGDWLMNNPTANQKHRQQITESRSLLENFCRQKNLPYYNSQTNFITIKFPLAQQMVKNLAKDNFLVKDLSDYPDGGSAVKQLIRISLPPPAVTKKLIKAIEKNL